MYARYEGRLSAHAAETAPLAAIRMVGYINTRSRLTMVMTLTPANRHIRFPLPGRVFNAGKSPWYHNVTPENHDYFDHTFEGNVGSIVEIP